VVEVEAFYQAISGQESSHPHEICIGELHGMGFSDLSIVHILPAMPTDTVLERTNDRVWSVKKKETKEKVERQKNIKAGK
jgi:hypothetical protein